jgi:hypothetical protein
MDVKSQKSIAIHWGTFALASEVILTIILIGLRKYFQINFYLVLFGAQKQTP